MRNKIFKIILFILIFLIFCICISLFIDYKTYKSIRTNMDIHDFLKLSAKDIKIEIIYRHVNVAEITSIEDKQFILDELNKVNIKRISAYESLLGDVYYDLRIINLKNNSFITICPKDFQIYINNKLYTTNLNLYEEFRNVHDSYYHDEFYKGKGL